MNAPSPEIPQFDHCLLRFLLLFLPKEKRKKHHHQKKKTRRQTFSRLESTLTLVPCRLLIPLARLRCNKSRVSFEQNPGQMPRYRSGGSGGGGGGRQKSPISPASSNGLGRECPLPLRIPPPRLLQLCPPPVRGCVPLPGAHGLSSPGCQTLGFGLSTIK